MKRILSLLVLIPLLAACNQPKQELFFLNWAEYIPDEVIKTFEEREGITVKVDTFDEPEAMLSKLRAGADSEYDLVMSPEYYIGQLVRGGVVRELDQSKIPNLANLAPDFANPDYDPGNKHSVPYQWGTTGIGYRTDKVTGPVDSWAVFFDAEQQVGDFFLIAEMREGLSSALRYLGYSANSTDPNQLDQAKDMLLEAKQRSKGFLGGTEAKNRLLAGDAGVVIAYNGDILEAADENPNIRFVIPNEGTTIWVDAMVVPAKAKNPDLAYKFINYLLEPETAAKISNELSFASPVATAEPFLNPELKSDPAVYPTPEVRAKLEFLRDLGDGIKNLDAVWTEVRAR